MPFIWTKTHSSPARQRRNEVAEICGKHGARLVENQLFYDDQGEVHALIEVPDDESKNEALMAELEAHEWLGKVSADEHEDGKSPPKSGRKD